ncbi:phosphoenolpyruvate carboxykinase [Hyphomicrobiales bacterium]|nr:phosphoenolpyruvate carboxykinase [Hyphomicrobiales bacterium]
MNSSDINSKVNRVYTNNSAAELIQIASMRAEGLLTVDGSFSVETGQHTGRSPKDKHIICDANTENEIWWDNNAKITRENFELLDSDMNEHMAGKELFIQDLYAGADLKERIKVRVITEFAWQALFIQHLLILPPRKELDNFTPDLTIIDLPSFNTDPKKYGVRTETTIACDFLGGKILIAGTYYAGEIKKSVFTYLNYTLPAKGIFPMHCSANSNNDGSDAALFFGLSGTGKTTLSADPKRVLVGDDEHGWTDEGIFNFEDGSYAKAINLSKQAEPQIYNAVRQFSSVLENVVVDEESRELNFNDGSLTENTRAAFPMSFVGNVSKSGVAGHPKTVILLTCDAFGVIPPIARLTPDEAVYHFLSGYTAKVAGTEKGVIDPVATFSTCFAAPFLPRHPKVYGDLLKQKMEKYKVKFWLINTGWSGGPAGIGSRMPIALTRSLLKAALSGNLDKAEMRKDQYFGFDVPVSINGDASYLNPRETWIDKDSFDSYSKELVGMFNKNFKKFEDAVDESVVSSGPSSL